MVCESTQRLTAAHPTPDRAVRQERCDQRETSLPGPTRAPRVRPVGDRTTLLAVSGLEVVYGGVADALRGVSLEVDEGEVVAVLGANGAGKTTLLRAVSGLLPVHQGRATRGDVLLDGVSILGRRAPVIVRKGVAQVMEGRRIFAELSVDENLRAGGFTQRDRARARVTYDAVLEMFPVLARAPTGRRGLPLRRRAADACNRSRAHDRAAAAAPRRAVSRARAPDPGPDPREDRRDQRRAGRACSSSSRTR